MKIVRLELKEDIDFAGVDAIALVENPAIELDFLAFKSIEEENFRTYGDYPKGAVSAAKQGIKRNKEQNNKCGTLVGKQRAQQLANGENLSLDTIKRMRSFLLRQKDNYELQKGRGDYDKCGYISYLLWGGPAALPWAEKKLRQEGELKASTEEIIMEEFVKSADGFTVGDYVSWTFAGRQADADRGRGQITDIRVEGTVKIPDSDFEFKPTEDNPLALIKTRTGKIVGQYTKNLRKIQKPDDFSADDLEVAIITDVLKEHGIIRDTAEKSTFSMVSEDKRMIAAPIMIADKLIRRNKDGEEYFVYFNGDTIEQLAHKYMKEKRQDSVNLEHDPEQEVDSVTLVESWITGKSDRSQDYGFNLPEKSWFGLFKVEDDGLWERVKSGEFKGVSVEGFFKNEVVEEFIDVEPGEDKDAYVARCMASGVLKREFPDEKQRLAVCLNDYDRKR